MQLNDQHLFAQILLRSWPFPNGRGRLCDTLFSGLSLNRTATTIITRHGFPLVVVPNDHIGRHLYLTGEFDPTTYETLAQFGKPGDVLLDIGAHVGYVGACFLHHFSGSSVVAVEPQPAVFALLEHNLSQFGERQKTMHCAVSDTEREALFEINAVNSGASRLSENGTIRVHCVAAHSLKTANPDLLKIDVEGHELEILGALLPALSKQPRAIVFEDQKRLAAPRSPLGRLFAEFNYDVKAIKKRLIRTDLVPVKSEADCNTNDYVAVSRGVT